MRPILVAGKNGQLARCLADVGGQRAVPIFSTERPEFDLEDSRSIERVVTAIFPRAIVNAAAYTAVDLAESNAERAFAVNRDGAGATRGNCATLGHSIYPHFDRLCV